MAEPTLLFRVEVATRRRIAARLHSLAMAGTGDSQREKGQYDPSRDNAFHDGHL
jgi:hypothetical protein